MTEHDRREFLKKLARTAVYVAPVVYSLAAPVELAGQGTGHGHHPKAAGVQTQQQQQPTKPPPGSPPPWQQPPPGSTPPGRPRRR
jgi:hypothetical protein